jgi:hypothetical protein
MLKKEVARPRSHAREGDLALAPYASSTALGGVGGLKAHGGNSTGLRPMRNRSEAAS